MNVYLIKQLSTISRIWPQLKVNTNQWSRRLRTSVNSVKNDIKQQHCSLVVVCFCRQYPSSLKLSNGNLSCNGIDHRWSHGFTSQTYVWLVHRIPYTNDEKFGYIGLLKGIGCCCELNLITLPSWRSEDVVLPIDRTAELNS